MVVYILMHNIKVMLFGLAIWGEFGVAFCIYAIVQTANASCAAPQIHISQKDAAFVVFL